MNDDILKNQANKTWEMLQELILQNSKQNMEIEKRFKETDQKFKET
ncbi:hypothetical protein MHK_003083 [Candidatus Magnetomorum sp. HK-1]|nr:hypothetical protein MHK_003083 [Candidatus Magnetomorum sp. HK-1]